MTDSIDLEALAQTFPSLTIQPVNELQLIEEIRQVLTLTDPITSRVRLSDLLAYLSEFYHNHQELVDDSTYDQIQDIYEENFGEYLVVGAPIAHPEEGVALEYYLGSLKKLKKEDAIERWQRQHPGPYVLEDKIDGITLLYVSTQVEGQRVHKLYTRGQGKIGQDVSHVYRYLNIPPLDFDVAIRGEAVFTNESFERVGVDLKSARSAVSGAILAKDSFNPTIVQEIKFVAYRIMDSTETPETQILQLMALGFMVPWATIAETITVDSLKSLYEQRLIEAPYEMDGLVIYQNIAAKYPSDKPPENVMAFKVNLKAVETTVIEVKWKTSREGRLKPVIHYQPVEWSENLDETKEDEVKASATLTKASGHNARYVLLNKVGPGARILVTRSNKTIPYIVSVLQPSSEYSFPDPNVFGDYEWNETETELYVKNANLEMLLAQLEFFLEKIGVKNIGPARVKAMADQGLNTISAIINARPEDFLRMERVGPDLAHKMYNEIQQRIKNVPLETIMAACGIFPNVGERRFKSILEVYPNLMDSARCDVSELAEAIRSVKGFNKLADLIAENLSAFADWLEAHPAITVRQPGVLIAPGRVVNSNQTLSSTQSCSVSGLTQAPGTLLTIVSDPSQPRVPQNLVGMTFVFSGFRGDLGRELEAGIEARGGRVTSSVSKKTTGLIMKDLGENTTKSQSADKNGTPKLTVDQFRQQYFI